MKLLKGFSKAQGDIVFLIVMFIIVFIVVSTSDAPILVTLRKSFECWFNGGVGSACQYLQN